MSKWGSIKIYNLYEDGGSGTPGRDLGDTGLSPASGSRHGACFSLSSACVSASVSLSVYHK